MINTEKLKRFTALSTGDLSRILNDSGYTSCAFESARFEGIVKSGGFAYAVTFYDDYGTEELEPGTVFVYYDHDTGKLSADF